MPNRVFLYNFTSKAFNRHYKHMVLTTACSKIVSDNKLHELTGKNIRGQLLPTIRHEYIYDQKGESLLSPQFKIILNIQSESHVKTNKKTCVDSV